VDHDPELTSELAHFFLRKAYEGGDPPFNDEKWLEGCCRTLQQQNSPAQIRSKVLGVRAAAAGKRITQCREVRGTHGMDYIWDPEGTDQPPEWWNREIAKQAEETRST
jgi:hypothetical protein